MSINIGNLDIGVAFAGDTAGLQKATAEAQQGIDRVGATTSKAMRQVREDTKGVEDALGRLSQGFKGAVIGSSVAVGLITLKNTALEAAGAIIQAQVQLDKLNNGFKFGAGGSAGGARELAFVLDQIKQCNGQSGCDQIIEQLQNSIKQGGWQHNPEQLKDRCHGPNPMSCVNDIQNMSGSLELLKDPVTRQLLGERATEILIERQLRDIAYTMVMVEQGQVKFEHNKDILEAMYGLTKRAIELCAVVPLAGPCRVADGTLTAAEIGVSVARGDVNGVTTQLISEGAAQVVGDGVAKSLSSKWWGNIYGY
jgi:hypothetical protein